MNRPRTRTFTTLYLMTAIGVELRYGYFMDAPSFQFWRLTIGAQVVDIGPADFEQLRDLFKRSDMPVRS